MKILYAVAVFSFAVLIWATVAITRHIRKGAVKPEFDAAADAEMSQALDVRLSSFARPSVADERSAAKTQEPPGNPGSLDHDSHTSPQDGHKFPKASTNAAVVDRP